MLERIPEYLYDLGSVFSEEESSKLPKHSSYDHEIKLLPGTQPPYGALYPMNEYELNALKEYLNVKEAAGKIRESGSSRCPCIVCAKAQWEVMFMCRLPGIE